MVFQQEYYLVASIENWLMNGLEDGVSNGLNHNELKGH